MHSGALVLLLLLVIGMVALVRSGRLSKVWQAANGTLGL